MSQEEPIANLTASELTKLMEKFAVFAGATGEDERILKSEDLTNYKKELAAKYGYDYRKVTIDSDGKVRRMEETA